MFEAKFCAQWWGMTPVAITNSNLRCPRVQVTAHQRGCRGRAHQHLGETAKAHAEYTSQSNNPSSSSRSLCWAVCARQWCMASPLQLVYTEQGRRRVYLWLVAGVCYVWKFMHSARSSLLLSAVGAAEWVLESNWWCCWRERLGVRLMD